MAQTKGAGGFWGWNKSVFKLVRLVDKEKTKNYFIKNPDHLEKYKEFVGNADVVACPLNIEDPIDFGTDPLGMKDFTIT